MRIRIKFTKLGALKFIGHLDLMRTFQKIFRRSGIPIAYSEGFNPHQIFSIAAPISVGLTSEGEYIDVKLAKEESLDIIKESINKISPKGLEFTKVVKLDDKEPAAMASVTAAKYVISQNENIITTDLINKFASNDQIIIKKKSKKGKINEIDIKPGIINININDENNIIMTLSTGSKMNVKPDIVLKTLCEFNDIEYSMFDFKIHRQDLYYGDDSYTPLSIPMIKI